MVVSAHIGTCGQWLNHLTPPPTPLLHNLNTLHAFSLKHISSFQLVFKAAATLSINIIQSFDILSAWASRQEQSHLCSPAQYTPLLIQGLAGTLVLTPFQQALACSFDDPLQHCPPLYAPFLLRFHWLFLQVLPTVDACQDMRPMLQQKASIY